MSQVFNGQPQFQRIPNRSLLTNDIVGAQSKPRHFYVDRSIKPIDQEQLIRLQRLNKIDDPFLGRRKYQNDGLNAHNQIIPQGDNYFFKGGRRHYEKEDGEIKQNNLQQNDHSMPFPSFDDFDRALYTKDIEGTAPGTLISKVVKNKELAQRQKKQQQIQRFEMERQQQNCKILDAEENNLQNYRNQEELQQSQHIPTSGPPPSYFQNLGQSLLTQNQQQQQRNEPVKQNYHQKEIYTPNQQNQYSDEIENLRQHQYNQIQQEKQRMKSEQKYSGSSDYRQNLNHLSAQEDFLKYQQYQQYLKQKQQFQQELEQNQMLEQQQVQIEQMPLTQQQQFFMQQQQQQQHDQYERANQNNQLPQQDIRQQQAQNFQSYEQQFQQYPNMNGKVIQQYQKRPRPF